MVDGDLEFVLTWRNHPDVRRFMYTTHEISFDEHARWFKAASADSSRHLLLLELAGLALGYVNFRCDGAGGAVWGFYLAPDAPKGRGRLLGDAATRHAFEALGLQTLRGEVLPANVASRQFHLLLGFLPETAPQGENDSLADAPDVLRFVLTRSDWESHQEKRT
jgi:UDP-4-amino-4,6-dideoxy-N-acetyl-beta-L-altrosamine N-acetyltransferase